MDGSAPSPPSDASGGLPGELHGEALEARIDELYQAQQTHFDAGRTLSLAAREDALRALLHALQTKESTICEALHADLHKSGPEAYLTEIGFVTGELKHILRHLGRWMKPDATLPPLAVAPSRGYVHHQPLGMTLIIAPWNYPVQLALSPLAGALAAGNVAIVKPSELAPASSAVIADIIRDTFGEEHVAAVEGGIDTSKALLARRWDHIFFTGGTNVGRIVAKAGAENLSRVTLELGGKSPTIVTSSANLDVAAKRIIWGKLVNAGQTCIAPDYMLVDASIHDGLVARMKAAITEFLGAEPKAAAEYGRIINERHFDRLIALIDDKANTDQKIVADLAADRLIGIELGVEVAADLVEV